MELKINQKIKLIIWDMDETFWKGTLSEEKIEFLDENIQFLKTLTDRGIMNSISSKNEFENVKKKLIEKIFGSIFYFQKFHGILKGNKLRIQFFKCNYVLVIFFS